MAEQYELVFPSEFLIDLAHWVRAETRVASRIIQLCLETGRDPRGGIGKPEMLKHRLAGLWSRRITGEHRLVYGIVGTQVRFRSCRFHYTEH